VPESIVEQLASSSATVQLGGEERIVSVMFCDIRGFTSWAETQSPEQVVGELNGLLGGLAALVMESGGTLDKFTGDGLMAFWGAPLEQPDHAERACRTAFAMQRLLLERARDAQVTPFRIGIGVTSGTVVVGNVGHEQRLEYTAIGDTVNLAARLEQSTKELEITTAMSHETWELLPPVLQQSCPEAATLQVRGRTQPVRVHELAGTLEHDDAEESTQLHAL
jgi:adenylate cyclase